MNTFGKYSSAFLAIAIAALASREPRAASTDNWPMYQGNPGHTGYVSQTLLADRARAAWLASLPGTAPPRTGK